MDLARGADLLVLEAANPFKVPGHLTPAEAGRLAAQAGVARLLLTHFYPPCDAVDVVALAAQEFSRRNPAGRRRPEPHRVIPFRSWVKKP